MEPGLIGQHLGQEVEKTQAEEIQELKQALIEVQQQLVDFQKATKLLINSFLSDIQDARQVLNTFKGRK